MLESLFSVSVEITAAFQRLPLQRSWADLTSCFNLKLGFVWSCSSQEQTIMCGHVNAGTNGNGCIQEPGNHYVPAITGSHIVQFFPESEPQPERPLDSPDFVENKTWLIFWRFLMVVIPHSEPVPQLTVQWPHQSPTLLPDSFPSIPWCWQPHSHARLNPSPHDSVFWKQMKCQTTLDPRLNYCCTCSLALWHGSNSHLGLPKLEELNVHTQLCVV